MAESRPSITAVLVARNAAATLERLLDGLDQAGIGVVLVDHGSTDETWSIAERRRAAPVIDLIREPYTGVFDLTRQLVIRREIISGLHTDWVLNCDADEFVDLPPGVAWHELLHRADAASQVAFDCNEFVFLPRSEQEMHASATFEATMRHFVHLRQRDPKQRVFRRGAPLDLWEWTGGHTVTLDPAQIADQPLTLRHYPALCLDEMRAQYYGRVFSLSDRTKFWHGGRIASLRYDVVAPAPDVLRDRDVGGLPATGALRRLPVFDPCPEVHPDPATRPTAHLALAGEPGRAGDRLRARLVALFPGLRIRPLRDVAEALAPGFRTPVLHLIEHPGSLGMAEMPDDVERLRATGWVRRIGVLRQLAVSERRPYLELRVEDCGEDAVLTEAVRRLLGWPAPTGIDGFVRAVRDVVSECGLGGIAACITGAMARDLHYL